LASGNARVRAPTSPARFHNIEQTGPGLAGATPDHRDGLTRSWQDAREAP